MYNFKDNQVKNNYQEKLKSKRAFEYMGEQASRTKKRLILIAVTALIIGAVYFLFSGFFKLKNISYSGNNNISAEELDSVLNELLNQRNFLVLPQKNYFFLNKSKMRKDFQKKYTLADLEINKDFPNGLKVKVIERVGQFIWQTGDRYFLMNLNGQTVKELPIKDIVNIKMPKIQDTTNSEAPLGEKLLSAEMITFITEVYDNFSQLGLAGVELDFFRMDSPKANYLKLVTKQGFEIHISDQMTLEQQFNKLKRSLQENKIDLTKIQYINLRIDNQVIYR